MDPSSDIKPPAKSGSGGSITKNDSIDSGNTNSGSTLKILHNTSSSVNSIAASLLPPPSSTSISLLHNAQDDSDFDEESVPLLQLSQLNSNNNSNSSTNSNSPTNSNNNNIKLQRQQKKRRERAQRLQAERTGGTLSNQTPVNSQIDSNNKSNYRSANDLISNAITSATVAVTGAIGVSTTSPSNFKVKSSPLNSSTITSADAATLALNNCSLNSGNTDRTEPNLSDAVTPNGNTNNSLNSFNNSNNNSSKIITNNSCNSSSSSTTTSSTSASVLLPAPNSIHNTNNINSSNDLVMLQTPASILANQLLHPQPISLTTGVVGMEEDDEDDESVDEDLLSTSSSSTLLLPREKIQPTRALPLRNNLSVGRKNQSTPVKNLGFISPDSPVLEEDIIDGFSILAFKTYEDLEYAVKFAQKKKEKRLSALEELTSSYCLEEKSPKIIELGPHHNNREKDMRDREREWNDFHHNHNNNQIQQQNHLLINNNHNNNNSTSNNNNINNNNISNNKSTDKNNQTSANLNNSNSLNNVNTVNNSVSNVNSLNNLNLMLNSANCNSNSNSNNVNNSVNNSSNNINNGVNINNCNKINSNNNTNINKNNIINMNNSLNKKSSINVNGNNTNNSNNTLSQSTTILKHSASRNSHTSAQDTGTSDDSGRASERLTTSSVAPRDTDCSRDRLSDASSRCSSEKGYICDSEGDDDKVKIAIIVRVEPSGTPQDSAGPNSPKKVVIATEESHQPLSQQQPVDKVSDGGSVVFPSTPTQISSNATPNPATPRKPSEFQTTGISISNGPLGERSSPIPAASQTSVSGVSPILSPDPVALPPPNGPPPYSTQMQVANGPITTQLSPISGSSQSSTNNSLSKIIQNVATTSCISSSVASTNTSTLPPSHFNQAHIVPLPSPTNSSAVTALTTTAPITNNTLSLSSTNLNSTTKQITPNVPNSSTATHQQQQSFIGSISCSPLSTLANGFSVSMSSSITTSHPITSSRISTASPHATTSLTSTSTTTNSNQTVSTVSVGNGSITNNIISPAISLVSPLPTTVSSSPLVTSGQVLQQPVDISLPTSQINNSTPILNSCVLSTVQSNPNFEDGSTSTHQQASIVNNGNNLPPTAYRSPYPSYPLYTPYGDYRHNPYLPPSVPSPSASPRTIDTRGVTSTSNSRGESALVSKSAVRPLTPLNNAPIVNSNISSNNLNSNNNNSSCNVNNSNNNNPSLGVSAVGMSHLTTSVMQQLNPIIRDHHSSSHHSSNSQIQHSQAQYSQSQRSQIHHQHQSASIQSMQSSTGHFPSITSCHNTSSSASSVIPRTHSPRGHSPNRERESYGSVSSLSRSSNTPSTVVPYSSAPSGPSPSLPYSTSTHGTSNSSPLPTTAISGGSSSIHYSKSAGWCSATTTSPVVTNTVTRPTPPPVSCVSISPHHSISSVPSSTIATSSVASHSSYQQTIFATPLPPTASIVSTTASTTAPHPFSAESLLNNKTDQADLLRRELDSRFLDRSGLAVQPGPYLRQELHHHQHQHTHLHQHQQILSSAPPNATPLFPPPLFKDLPKIGAVDSPFYRTGLGIPTYPGYSPGLLHPAGLGGPTPFVPPSHLPSFAPKQQNPIADPIKPQTMKTGRWNAMHVRIAWQIYKDQNEKQGSDKSSNICAVAVSSSSNNPATTSLKPPTTAMDMLRPSTHLFPSSAATLASLSRPHELPSAAYPSSLSGRSPYDTAPLPPTLFGASHLASPFTRYGPAPFSSPFSMSPFARDVQIGTPLHDPWRTTLSRGVAGYSSGPGQPTWPTLKPDPAIDAARREAEEREREREIREREHRERERQRQREREERERKEKEEKLKREQQEREARERERERKERERREIERREIAERERLLQQQRLNESTKLAAAQAAAVAARERSPLRNGTDSTDIRIKEEIPRKEDQELLMRSAAAAAAAAGDPRYHPSSAALAVAQAQAHHQFMTGRHGPHVLPPPPHLSRSMMPPTIGGPPLSHFGPPTGHPGWSLDPYRDPYGQMLRYNPLMEVIRVEEERKALSMHAAYSAAMRGKEPSPVPPSVGTSQPPPQHRISGMNVIPNVSQSQSGMGSTQSGSSQSLKSGPQSMASIQHGIPQHNMTVSIDMHKKDDSSTR